MPKLNKRSFSTSRNLKADPITTGIVIASAVSPLLVSQTVRLGVYLSLISVFSGAIAASIHEPTAVTIVTEYPVIPIVGGVLQAGQAIDSIGGAIQPLIQAPFNAEVAEYSRLVFRVLYVYISQAEISLNTMSTALVHLDSIGDQVAHASLQFAMTGYQITLNSAKSLAVALFNYLS